MRRLRTFVAVEFPSKVKERLRAPVEEIDRLEGKIRTVPLENVHLTLKFLGDVKEVDLYRLCEACRIVADRFPQMALAVEGIGVFPGLQRPRVFWAGVRPENDAPIAGLHSALDEASAPFGVGGERRSYHPHLTLARARYLPGVEAATHLLSRWEGRFFGRMMAKEICLFQSELRPQGALHVKLGTFPLGGAS